MLDVEQWAEIRRMHEVEGLSIREIARRSGRDRNTVRSALRSAEPPRCRWVPRPSKLDPFKEEIGRLLKDDAKLPAPTCAPPPGACRTTSARARIGAT